MRRYRGICRVSPENRGIYPLHRFFPSSGLRHHHAIYAGCQSGSTAVGLSGLDGRLLTARPSPKVADLGFVGEVARVDPTILCSLIDTNHIPVVTSVVVAVEDSGQPYNINADTVAGELAAALGARS
ncbi:hypothetical protein VIGAN_03088300 [Vigna angularis var. angularis]|uniref:Aspartate/glutamate/uridylate kinase domain-containing protein n=1 Tax=Vigna angularis var. angularis TaxID=157739 RepID=A0A0S3RL00_PHAAN|nr:hypothetical protein VIGAN_03088300 [Vigna angularis var. angularis]